MFDPVDYEFYRSWWKRSRPSSQGYQKCYQAKTPTGDFLQAEFNFHEGLVKIEVKPVSEKGVSFQATIKRGTVIREKDSSGGNSYRNSVKKGISPYHVLFSSLPDSELVDSLIGAYGITKIQPIRKQPGSTRNELLVETKEAFQNRIPKWQKVKEFLFGKKDIPFKERFRERAFDDFHDLVLGLSLASILYFHFFDYVILGSCLASLGFLFGGMDWTLRNRSPLFTKVLLFLFSGSYFFYTGYTRF
ncbi:MAG: hypothetical protein SFU98_19490 [Leptospiraceae bacterium]|nr:hypothetical protein [Leptospiraceae bacterium]